MSIFTRFIKKRVSKRAEYKRMLQRKAAIGLPDTVWGTKGFEFWTFLSLLLHRAGSKRILELGSGRSTVSFAEYAKFNEAEFLSIETSKEWLKKAEFELHFLGLPHNLVKHVELDKSSGWYQLDKFRSHVNGLFDCILIDAPNESLGSSREMRNSEAAISELSALCKGADILLIDDVHRKHVFETIDVTLNNPDEYDTYFFDYSARGGTSLNTISISLKKSSAIASAIFEIKDFLGLKLDMNRTVDQCIED